MKLSTTKEIQIVSGKTLKLNHVLSRKMNGADSEEVHRVMHMFDAYAKSHKLTLYGPAILHSCSELKDGVVAQQIELMGQVREIPRKILPPYSFNETIRIENCLLVRYHGNIEKLPLAYSKLEIHCFENDLILQGEIYTVILEEKENIITADIFAEVSI